MIPDEIECILNECSGNLSLQDYRDLLENLISEATDRLNVLDQDEL